jgi:hypothetical protein
MHTHKSYTSKLQGLRLMHTGDASEYDYSSFCASALPHQHRAPRLLVSWSHLFYINNAVRRDYSSPGCTDSTSAMTCDRDYSFHGNTGSTSTTPCAAATSSSYRAGSTLPMPRIWVPRLLARLVVDYFAYAAHLGASARCRLLCLRRAFRCLGSLLTTSPTPHVWVPRLIA